MRRCWPGWPRTIWSLNRGAEAVEIGRAGAGHAPRRGPGRGAAAAAGLAGPDAVSARPLPPGALDDGEVALRRGGAGGRPGGRDRGAQHAGHGAGRPRRGRGRGGPAAPGDRVRRRGRGHSTAWPPPTPTSPTCSASPAGPRRRWTIAQEGMARAPAPACPQPRLDDADRVRDGVRGRRLASGAGVPVAVARAAGRLGADLPPAARGRAGARRRGRGRRRGSCLERWRS